MITLFLPKKLSNEKMKIASYRYSEPNEFNTFEI